MVPGDEIILKIETNNQEKKQKTTIIRLIWHEKTIGRLDSEYSEYFHPLIEKNYIYTECKFVKSA
jgi:hypothetical protein